MNDRRVVFPSAWHAQWEEVALPDRPGPGQLLVRTLLTVVNYGTVVAIYTGTHININRPGVWPKYPHHPSGHSVGVVCAVGEGVMGYAEGDRVSFNGRYCRYQLLDLPASRIVKVPQDVSDLEAVVAAHASISLHGVRLAHMTIGERVIVFGAGVIGLCAALYALAAGAVLVAVVDPVETRLWVARECGVDCTLNPEKVDVEAEAKALTDGKGFDVAIEATGAPAVLPVAVHVTRPLGRVVILSSPRGKVELDTYNDVHRGGISLIGAHGGTAPGQENAYYPWSTERNIATGWELVRRGRLSFAKLVTHRIKANETLIGLFDRLAKEPDQYLGVVIDWAS